MVCRSVYAPVLPSITILPTGMFHDIYIYILFITYNDIYTRVHVWSVGDRTTCMGQCLFRFHIRHEYTGMLVSIPSNVLSQAFSAGSLHFMGLWIVRVDIHILTARMPVIAKPSC